MTTPQRRSLLPAQPITPRAVSEADIVEVASKNGFQPVVNEVSAPVAMSPQRRHRQPTRRDHQFNVRLRRETIDFIYAEANGRNVPIAQVIEEMTEALKRQQGRG